MHDRIEHYLAPGRMVDSDHPAVQAFATAAVAGKTGDREKAVALYYAVRDGFRYDPYAFDLEDTGLTGSSVLSKGHGWCVTKAALLTAACRAVGIPASVGYADVKNHLSTERMRQLLQTEVFYWHGYSSIYIDGQWLKATPAFNLELCTRFKLLPLEFDGTQDSIYHPFDVAGNQHMEYLNHRGDFADVPAASIRADFARYYPKMTQFQGASFERDTALEVSRPGLTP